MCWFGLYIRIWLIRIVTICHINLSPPCVKVTALSFALDTLLWQWPMQESDKIHNGNCTLSVGIIVSVDHCRENLHKTRYPHYPTCINIVISYNAGLFRIWSSVLSLIYHVLLVIRYFKILSLQSIQIMFKINKFTSHEKDFRLTIKYLIHLLSKEMNYFKTFIGLTLYKWWKTVSATYDLHSTICFKYQEY